MNDYTRFMAWGRKNTDVVWSDPYEDASGLGLVVTAALPVYSPDAATPDENVILGRLVAVVGRDTRVSEFEEVSPDLPDIIARLRMRSKACTDFNLHECLFQVNDEMGLPFFNSYAILVL